eukprot:241598_1
MVNRIPSKNELKCTGCSFVIAQILLLSALVMHSIDYDLYAVTKEEQVIELHNLLSSQKHRAEIETGVALAWLSLPFLLIGLYGIKKLLVPMYHRTAGELWVYVAEKSYIIFIAVITVIVPAVSLTASSFEWSFEEYSPEVELISSGYYIQLSIVLFTAEIIDCVAVADATFMIALFVMPRFIMKDRAKVKRMKAVIDPNLPKCLRDMKCFLLCHRIVTIGFVISLFLIFCTILFEFGKKGFHSPLGRAKYAVIWSFALKILVGLKICGLGFSNKYDDFVKVLFNEDVIEFQVEAISPDAIQTSINKNDDRGTGDHSDGGTDVLR